MTPTRQVVVAEGAATRPSAADMLMEVPASVVATLSWAYDNSKPKSLRQLYEKAKGAQWNAATEIDWSLEVPFGEPLADGSVFNEQLLRDSPLAPGGRRLWDRFRWEQQSWLTSQFLHGEQGALVASARLAEALPDLPSKLSAATQVMDEARHVEAFARYLDQCVPEPYPVSKPLASLLDHALRLSDWDFTALGMQVVIEPLALGAFRAADALLHDDLIRQITRYVARDEARHVSFGIHILAGRFEQLTQAERRQREDFVLMAADLMVQRLLLEDVWERLGMDSRKCVAFAASNPMMVQYRAVMFAKVISTLRQIGMMTPRVVAGLERLGLRTSRHRASLTL